MGRIFNTIRSIVLPPVGRLLAEREDWYVTSTTHRREYVGLLDAPVNEVVSWLRTEGFVANPLAAYKTLQGTDATETASLAWRGDKDHLLTEGYLPPSDPLADKQLHVVCFEVDGDRTTTAMFAHWEYSWTSHPIKHYRGVEMNDRGGANLARQFVRHRRDDYSLPKLEALLDE